LVVGSFSVAAAALPVRSAAIIRQLVKRMACALET
jgi:hypothetical protein